MALIKCTCIEEITELQKRVTELEYLQKRKKCSEGYHSGERQVIESIDRIWVRCSICYGDLSENAHIKKPA